MQSSSNFGQRLTIASWCSAFLCTYAALMPLSVAVFARQMPPATQAHDHMNMNHAEPQPSGGASEDSNGHRAQPSPEDDVLTIRYQCLNEKSEVGVCAIAVAKIEFDALVQALDPNMSADSRQSLATEYSRLLIMAVEARRRGIDRLPEIKTLLRFADLQVLATRVVQEISVRPPIVSLGDVERYFSEHRRDYQEVFLSRILVSSKPKDTRHSIIPAAERAEAMRKRAINGEDFAVLQHEIAGSTPGTAEAKVQIGPLLCQSLPEPQRQVCDLQPGQVSMVLPDSLGFVIYRLESRRPRGLDEVRDQIRAMLERQSVQEEIEKIRTPLSLDLDEAYFGKLPKPDVAMEHGMHFPVAGTTTPAQAAPLHQH
jgi:hypothetical protein